MKYIKLTAVISFVTLMLSFYYFSGKYTHFLDGNGVNTNTGISYSLTGERERNEKVTELIDSNIDNALLLAKEDFKKYKGRNIENLNQLQRIYLDLGNYKEAITYGRLGLDLMKEIKMEPDSIREELIGNLLYALILNGNYGDATDIISDYKSNKDLNLELYQGLIFYKKEDYVNAIAVFDKLNKLEKKYYFLGKTYEKLGKTDSSIEYFLKLKEAGLNLIKEKDYTSGYVYYYTALLRLEELGKKNFTNERVILEKELKDGTISKKTGNSIDMDVFYNDIRQDATF